MSKLDEIEARTQNTLFGQVGEPRAKHPYFRGEHAKLLIRAVRQLGAWVSENKIPFQGDIDPDVLELLEVEE